MTDHDDPLARLKGALQAAPAVKPEAREAALRLAMENFDRLQGSTEVARPKKDRPRRAGFLTGVTEMFKTLNSRPLLAATTSAAALCLGLVVILPLVDDLPLPGRIVIGEGQAGKVPPTQPAEAQQNAPVLKEPVAEAPIADALPADDGRARVEVPKPELTAPITPEPEVLAQVAPELDATVAETRDEARVMADEAPMMEAEAATIAPAPAPQARKPAPAAAAKRAIGGATAPMEGFAPMGIVAEQEIAPLPEPNTETFVNAVANPVKVTAEEPVSTFSIDVDTASYAVVRSSLNAGFLPDPASVRVEEMVNYFPYAYPTPAGDAAFRPTITVMPTPWNPDTRLVHIGIQGAMPAVAARPALNLVFLIDTSGSMEDPNKLPLLKQSLALMLPELRPEDQVAIVAYAGSAGQVLPPTAASDRKTILAALDNLAAGGSTAGAEGIALAYQVAAGMAKDGEVSRVLLATDGDFNVGIDDPEALKTYIAKQRESGTYLSVLGFGRGNLDDATMQALAQNGNGTASYIDTLTEARKVLVDQLSGALFPIADNVKIQIEWNPATVAEYRLIGYETRALRREDFNNDKVDAGDIGAGTAVTAIYEVTAPGSKALLNDPLRYGTDVQVAGAGELGFLRLRSVAPGESASTLQETPIRPDTGPASDDARFAVAIAGFGQLLTGATYLGDWGWDQAIELAIAARGSDDFGYRVEAVNLMRLAESLSAE